MENLKLPANMTFCSAESSTNESLSPKPLILLFGWMMAKSAHIEKYRSFWCKRGYDIVTIETSTWDFLFPPPGSRRNFQGLIDFFSARKVPYEKIVLHNFSVGTFVSMDFLHQMIEAAKQDDQHLAHGVLASLKGIIMDSLAFTNSAATGAAKSLTNNPIGQFVFWSTMHIYLQLTRPFTLNHCYHLESVLFDNPKRLPGLFLFSRDDYISCPDTTFRLIDQWKSYGVVVREKCWDKSPHVLHYKHHPVEYEQQVDEFLEQI